MSRKFINYSDLKDPKDTEEVKLAFERNKALCEMALGDMGEKMAELEIDNHKKDKRILALERALQKAKEDEKLSQYPFIKRPIKKPKLVDVHE